MSSEPATTAHAPVAPGPAGAEHVPYVLGLADDPLIYTQRLGEWLTRAPQIEEDLALGNIALDLIGQARALLSRAGELEGRGRDEDALAYFRDEREFRNVHLVERPRGDFGAEMARLLWFSAYQHALYTALLTSADPVVSAVAAKALKEVAYHRDHARQWVVRLGDGTEESHDRMRAGLVLVEPYVAELFADDAASVAAAEAGVGVLPSSLQAAAETYVDNTLAAGTLARPDEPGRHARGGRDGVHSEALGYLLAEMQHLARSHPGATW